MKRIRAALHLGAALLLAGPLAGGDAAPTSSWWSLMPIVRPRIPADPTGWARTPIDAFVLEGLRSRGLEPSSEADRRTLIRRLFFDVHGLPPSPAEVEAFVTDPSPSAYEELVERLLASPRHGERWGRHWLDLVHYGESHGYDKDKRRPNAWPYRDYVIRAFNEDKPYTRFIEEQVAGDVLYPAERDAVLATGFIAAGPWDFVGHVELREGTTDKDIARVLDRDDMVATVMSTFTSVTAHCARCHDHKFDPIPQEDYYRLQAVFAGVDRADRPYDADPAVHRARMSLLAEKKALGEKLAALEAAAKRVTDPGTAALDLRIAELEARMAKAAGDKSPSNGYHSGILPVPDAVRWVEVDLGRIVALDRVVLHPARPTDFPDTPGFGFPARFRVEVSERPIDEGTAAGRKAIADHTTTDFPNPGDAAHVIPTGSTRARFIRVTATRLWERTADFVFALAELEAFEGGVNAALGASVRAHDSIEAGRWGKERLVDGWSSRDRIASEPAASPGLLPRIDLKKELERLRADRAAIVHSLLDEATRSAIEETAARLDAASQALGALPPAAMVYAAASELDAQGSFLRAVSPRPVHLLHRGEVKNRGELMAPGALSALPGLSSRFEIRDPAVEGERRAALAKWIAHPGNVLTWRSIVNRVWQHHFGTGIVDTPSDFGRMGSKPTHPELLDWLASTFVESGASLKDLHRLILRSAVYRQSSRDDPARSSIDSDNRFLWRMNRTRLDAESVRDALLAASGTLDLAMGGPSAEHFRFKDDHSPVYDYTGFDADSPASRRRSVYRFLVRSVPDPFMECLDCADPSILTPRRNTTLTALQALALLNTPFTLKQAEQFAGRVRGLSSSISGQVEAACLLALGRAPRPEEARILVAHAEAHGLENALRLIFNLNEFLFID